jgi:hypothetical protein
MRLVAHDAKRAAGGYQSTITKLSVVSKKILVSERKSRVSGVLKYPSPHPSYYMKTPA